jgi:endogenous inhibitor of DNA gyrase (YacG/DUF329 family)
MSLESRCPTCQKLTRKAEHPLFPFCSRGCKGRDLVDWANGKRAISQPPEGYEEWMELELGSDKDDF